jgi:hypothetical protein
MQLSPAIGLCAVCRHVQVVRSARDSFFVLCRLSKTDPHFAKYPVLPVFQCVGFTPPGLPPTENHPVSQNPE